MEDLVSLAIIWAAVFVAHFAAAKTRLTPVLWFLAMGSMSLFPGLGQFFYRAGHAIGARRGNTALCCR